MKVLELFSGIGGMHFSLKDIESAEVIAAADINTVANTVYRHNFPNVKIFEGNIQKLTAETINRLGVDTIVMSPPCQPFTRVGNRKDLSDNRSDALSHIITIIPGLTTINGLLLENVKGFEGSAAREKVTEVLTKCGFEYREFLLNPLKFGFPNTRERYYLVAVKSPFKFGPDYQPTLMTHLPHDPTPSPAFSIDSILEFPDESDLYDSHLLRHSALLKRIQVLDIVTKYSDRTCCFTKAYTHYAEGTGSVYSALDPDDVSKERSSAQSGESEDRLVSLERLRIRYFTPVEIQRLMCFPESFSFPKEVTLKQKYRLLGNSVNVRVVSKLMAVLHSAMSGINGTI